MVMRQPLARQWRPKQLSDVIGQPHVVKAIRYMLTHQSIHQALLLTGTRGVGKTTLGRIVARSVNCEQGISDTPCGQCYACQDISLGRYPDLIEIDAASRTKVEDTRDILEHTHYQPSHGRYKIFLIDEVHMLSNHSFNALLKTIEEPPKHVLFILATTDPDKLPETILSRCLHFQLHRMNTDQLNQYLHHILNEEKVPCDDESIQLIVKHAQGSVRDALTLCDQLIAQGEGQIKLDTVTQSLGLLPQETVFNLIQAAAEQDTKRLHDCFTLINQRYIQWSPLLNVLAETLHQLACIHAFPQYQTSEDLKKLAQCVSPELTQLFYQIVTLGHNEINHAPNHQIGGQMILMRMMHFTPQLPKPIRDVMPPKNQPQYPLNNIDPTPEPVVAPNTQKTEPTTNTQKTETTMTWEDCLQRFCSNGIQYQIFKNSTRTLSGKKWTIQIPSLQRALLTQQLQKRLQTQINEHLSAPITLSVQTCDDTDTEQTPSEQSNIDHIKQIFSEK